MKTDGQSINSAVLASIPAETTLVPSHVGVKKEKHEIKVQAWKLPETKFERTGE